MIGNDVLERVSTGQERSTSKYRAKDVDDKHRRPKEKKGISFHRKTRTGCFTCKKRRVKCDEARPVCKRCRVGGYVCDGYSTTTVTKANHEAGSSDPTNSVDAAVISLQNQPGFSLSFRDERGHLYFHAFQEVLTPEVANGHVRGVWTETVPRLCHGADFIRDITTALAALRLSTERRPESDNHYQHALRLYGSSLQSLQTSLGSQRCSLRQALTASLMMFTFEALNGDLHGAIAHAEKGSRAMLVNGWDVLLNNLTTSGPLEYDLINAIVHIKVQNLSNFGAVPLVEILDDLSHLRYTSKKAAIPDAFQDFETAERYFLILMCKSMLFIQVCLGFVKGTMDQGSKPPYFLPLFGYDVPFNRSLIPTDIWEEHSAYLQEMACWESRFGSMLLSTPHASSNSKRALLMKLYAITTRLQLHSLIFEDECAFDSMITDFSAAITLIKEYLASPGTSQRRSFTVDLNFISPLLVIILLCRDRALRREALEILRIPRQEGIWHSGVAASVTGRICKIEEFGLGEDDYIPRERRVRLKDARWRPEGMELQYVKLGTTGHGVTEIDVISVPFHASSTVHLDDHPDFLRRFWTNLNRTGRAQWGELVP